MPKGSRKKLYKKIYRELIIESARLEIRRRDTGRLPTYEVIKKVIETSMDIKPIPKPKRDKTDKVKVVETSES